MSKTKIDNYASVLIIPNGFQGVGEDRILTSRYDEGYPFEPFRNHLNLIGGNRSKEDWSPRATLRKELKEEFSGIAEEQKEIDPSIKAFVGGGLGAKKATNLAPQEDIDYVRNQLLMYSEPYYDFLIHVPPMGRKSCSTTLFSSFIYDSQNSGNLFEIAERNFAEGKSLINEGLLAVTSIDDIFSGKEKCAWSTTPVLGYLWADDPRIFDFPNPYGISEELVGLVRESYENYSGDFELKVRK